MLEVGLARAIFASIILQGAMSSIFSRIAVGHGKGQQLTGSVDSTWDTDVAREGTDPSNFIDLNVLFSDLTMGSQSKKLPAALAG